MNNSDEQIDNQTNLINFSFCDHKHAFEQYLSNYENEKRQQFSYIDDRKDFWKFVTKYESMLKHAGQPILNAPCSNSISELEKLKPYHKRKYISLQFSDTTDSFERSSNAGDRSSSVVRQHRNNEQALNPLRINQFKEMILIYLDFKQKEKFTQIKKLRKSQNSLPINRFKQQLQHSLKTHRVIIIAGDTGCGKSTQIPQYLYEFGYKNIACTQPRRLACVSLSKRVAHEMLNDYGNKVGFQIRFEKNKTANTNILFITEGLLLRQLAVESNLDQYDVLILDEIHERNLFGDFLLGVTKCLLLAKPNLKLILMSATINVDLFFNYFKTEDAKLLEVPGRLFPIKTVFMPPPALELAGGSGPSSSKRKPPKTANRLDPAPFVQILSMIDQKYPLSERGDVLIFVSGVTEITIVCEAIKTYSEQQSHWIVLPLHSGLALSDQDKVFDYAPENMRKCIVSTNIAETSLTVDGIRFVIDSGKVKEMSYDATCKGQRLKEFWVSKSSAEQRKGRAGRTGPGTCFRLFSQKQYDSFDDYPTPEILRVPLDTILLQMVAMGLPNVRAFPFIESPQAESIEQTILSLKYHVSKLFDYYVNSNALTHDEKITPLGKSLSNLPVDISIGKLLLMGCVFPNIQKILTLAAVMSVQNPFTNRAYTDYKCEQERNQYESDQGDIFILLKVYREWLFLKYEKQNTRKWCHKLGIEEQRFYEITKLRDQFQNILESCNMAEALHENNDQRTASSADRARRHGEIRMLKAMKRKQKYEEPRKRKILKHESNADDLDEDSGKDDIRDIDFRLKNDATKIDLMIRSAEFERHHDVLLLKLIILSGFYPQIAIADEFNYCKGGAQQFFHTSLKPFISIHPNSYFSQKFEILKLNDSDILEKPNYYTSKPILSTKHQMLCYQNLLETAKPYLTNCIRMPVAQTLLLFSYSIDTNASITRIVFDSWLCLDFPIPETGCEMLCRATNLRRAWMKLLSQKLTDLESNVESQTSSNRKNTHERQELWESLIDFMSVNVAYTVKRLLRADLKALYTNTNVQNPELLTINPFAEDFSITVNEDKGGINVSENIVYGCLREVEWTVAMDAVVNESAWKCKNCDHEIKMDVIEKLLHKHKCKNPVKNESDSKQPTTSNSRVNNGTQYFCKTCNRELLLTKIDILKHKKYCKL